VCVCVSVGQIFTHPVNMYTKCIHIYKTRQAAGGATKSKLLGISHKS
jgi:hypothetical protein